MIKDEQIAHTQFMKWLKYNLDKFPKSFLIESKIARRGKKSFAYNELSEKEERLLLRCKQGSIIQTHSDFGAMGTLCDGGVYSGGGFIFLKWIRPRNKTFYIIDIEDFIKARDNSSRKSLTEEDAKDIAYLIAEHI